MQPGTAWLTAHSALFSKRENREVSRTSPHKLLRDAEINDNSHSVNYFWWRARASGEKLDWCLIFLDSAPLIMTGRQKQRRTARAVAIDVAYRYKGQVSVHWSHFVGRTGVFGRGAERKEGGSPTGVPPPFRRLAGGEGLTLALLWPRCDTKGKTSRRKP